MTSLLYPVEIINSLNPWTQKIFIRCQIIGLLFIRTIGFGLSSVSSDIRVPNPPAIIIILILPGFFGFAGLHRIILGQVGLGILYILTVGLCFIGTIVDLVNYKSLAYEFNIKMAHETINMLSNSFPEKGAKES